MTEDEMESLRRMIVEASNQRLEEYDWDSAFVKYLEGK
jgi:hypothetical protein